LPTRAQGAVIIEAIIGPDGKVQTATVIHSVPLLDQAALDAVRRWEYEPTLLKGAAVAVIMTVVVNFALQ
jgi:protein TonB